MELALPLAILLAYWSSCQFNLIISLCKEAKNRRQHKMDSSTATMKYMLPPTPHCHEEHHCWSNGVCKAQRRHQMHHFQGYTIKFCYHLHLNSSHCWHQTSQAAFLSNIEHSLLTCFQSSHIYSNISKSNDAPTERIWTDFFLHIKQDGHVSYSFILIQCHQWRLIFS